uniref:Uncharacterized protein n=1 Tax=Alexandrium andersonii TaxID=327968 RepID=A0A7S2NHG0_9DINO
MEAMRRAWFPLTLASPLLWLQGADALRVEALRAGSGSLLQSRLELLHERRPVIPPGANCSAYPMFCQAPFNCGDVVLTREEKNTWRKRLATPDGHSNVRTFCWDLTWATSLIQECMINHNLIKSAKMVFQHQFQHGALELDGSYCFMEGHCTNPNINADSTYADAERDCDRKYGHDAWAQMGRFDAMRGSITGLMEMKMSRVNGFGDPNMTNAFGRLACAMGNYHCDVVYCKETYCKDPYFIRRYQHLAPRKS